jgi:hypothetical protein
MMVLLIGILTSLFIENTLSACSLILLSSFIAPFLRIRKYADRD